MNIDVLLFLSPDQKNIQAVLKDKKQTNKQKQTKNFLKAKQTGQAVVHTCGK